MYFDLPTVITLVSVVWIIGYLMTRYAYDAGVDDERERQHARRPDPVPMPPRDPNEPSVLG